VNNCERLFRLEFPQERNIASVSRDVFRGFPPPQVVDSCLGLGAPDIATGRPAESDILRRSDRALAPAKDDQMPTLPSPGHRGAAVRVLRSERAMRAADGAGVQLYRERLWL
jgi:hypothetical protein